MTRIRKIGIFSGVLILFSLGVISSQKQWWPANYYQQAYMAFEAQIERRKILSSINRPAAKIKQGRYGRVSNYDDKKAYNGYNFLCKNDLSPVLTDMNGKVVQRWKVRFRRIWPNPKFIHRPVPLRAISCVAGHLYPDGSVLIVVHGNGDTPYGYGLVKLDARSRTVWRYSQRVHHDVHVAENGDIYTLTHRFIKQSIKGLEYLHYPTLADYIVILDSHGKLKKSIPLLEALRDTPYEYMLKDRLKSVIDRKLYYDITHANSVKVLEKDMAKSFPQFKAGDILISMRVTNHLAVINPKKEKVIWAAKGAWYGQHDAQFMKDGSILFFDNRGRLRADKDRKKYSRIVMIDPETKKIKWEYEGAKGQHFYTMNKGDVDPLPNGNFLISSTDSKRMFEVTPKKELVWRYRIGTEIPVLHRFAPDYFDAAFCKKIGCNHEKLTQKPVGRE